MNNYNPNYNEVHAHDGYIGLSESGNTWVGVWANNVRYVFYKTCRKANIESNNDSLRTFILEVVQPVSNGLVFITNI